LGEGGVELAAGHAGAGGALHPVQRAADGVVHPPVLGRRWTDAVRAGRVALVVADERVEVDDHEVAALDPTRRPKPDHALGARPAGGSPARASRRITSWWARLTWARSTPIRRPVRPAPSSAAASASALSWSTSATKSTVAPGTA